MGEPHKANVKQRAIHESVVVSGQRPDLESVSAMRARLFELWMGGQRDGEEYKELQAAVNRADCRQRGSRVADDRY
jgi:hypothetical protein